MSRVLSLFFSAALLAGCPAVTSPEYDRIRDVDEDGYGSVCDPDLNNDGFTDFLDLGAMKAVFFQPNANADLNGSGLVDFLDLGILKGGFFRGPGPSGIAP